MPNNEQLLDNIKASIEAYCEANHNFDFDPNNLRKEPIVFIGYMGFEKLSTGGPKSKADEYFTNYFETIGQRKKMYAQTSLPIEDSASEDDIPF